MWGVRPGIDDRLMTRRALITPLAVAAAIAGCGGSSDGTGHNKAGAASARPQAIVLQATDPSTPEAQQFAKQVRKRSGGSLTVEMRQDYSSNTPANEAELARDLRNDQADFGMLPTRAWAAAGVKAFDALQAPFVLGSYDVARAAVAGPAGSALDASLGKAGVIPLGLVPAQLRRVLSVRPLVTSGAYRGRVIKVSANATSAAVIHSLGGSAIQTITGDDVQNWLREHRLDATEAAPIFVLGNDLGKYARYITGYALFDRVDSIVASPGAWKRLSPQQQAAVRAAAQDTVAFSASLPQRDGDDLAALCRAGVRVTTPTKAQLTALADATEPVRAALRRDPATGPVLEALERTAGAGPQALAAPQGCTKPSQAGAVPKAGPASIPNGTYQVRLSLEDFKRWGEYGPTWQTPIVWTMKLDSGRFEAARRPRLANDRPFAGTVTLDGDVARFRALDPGGNRASWTARWSYYNGELTWVPIDLNDLDTRMMLGAHPWKKVG